MDKVQIHRKKNPGSSQFKTDITQIIKSYKWQRFSF